eukprot:CAMPEP_0117671918 /NCGR_PEP_ID=MMETSP0804-20121206/13614_1 /TAXON_ID=1074897 /ORGANISM="Tetraselmis astigmatica, Strain CCMP880" /LENGTH=244 /DNA_ID=CAMNT_0005480459 /DNA_START=176 /DNA_END=910 /DNA_ORIENTATION=-
MGSLLMILLCDPQTAQAESTADHPPIIELRSNANKKASYNRAKEVLNQAKEASGSIHVGQKAIKIDLQPPLAEEPPSIDLSQPAASAPGTKAVEIEPEDIAEEVAAFEAEQQEAAAAASAAAAVAAEASAPSEAGGSATARASQARPQRSKPVPRAKPQAATQEPKKAEPVERAVVVDLETGAPVEGGGIATDDPHSVLRDRLAAHAGRTAQKMRETREWVQNKIAGVRDRRYRKDSTRMVDEL